MKIKGPIQFIELCDNTILSVSEIVSIYIQHSPQGKQSVVKDSTGTIYQLYPWDSNFTYIEDLTNLNKIIAKYILESVDIFIEYDSWEFDCIKIYKEKYGNNENL